MISIEQLLPYARWLVDTIPLHNYKRQYPNGKPRGKNPLHDEWTTKKYSQTTKQLQDWAENAYNVGSRINSSFIVLDLDPRNYDGHDSEQLIAEEMGFFSFEELFEHYPIVRTGSGGYHIYCQLPVETDSINIRTKLDHINGLDIKRVGGYVVSAGSIHPNGNPYEWACGEDELDIITGQEVVDRFPEMPAMTQDLYDSLYREVNPDLKKEGWGAYTPQQLEHIFLDKLNPSDYSSNDEWFPLLCAAHHATAGEGLEEFLDWSTSDPDYAADTRTIESRWNSLMDKENSYRAATLIMAVKEIGEDTTQARAVLDFGSGYDFEEDEDDSEIMAKAAKVGRAAGNKVIADIDDQIGLVGDTGNDIEDCKALMFISTLGEDPTDEQIATAIRLTDNAPSIAKAKATKLLLQILKPHGIGKVELKALQKDLMETEAKDLANEISDLCLAEVFNNKKHILYEPNQAVWIFVKTHWEEINREYLTKIALNTVQSFIETTKATMDQETMAAKVVSMMVTKTALRRTKLFPLGAPSAIINCLNGEIHINRDGTHKFSAGNNPKSYQKSVLACDYDPTATCPLYTRTLEEIFENSEDTDGMINYLMEIMGYMIQPRKDLGSWWLFKGRGGDGKTTICEILGYILGDAYSPADTSAIASGKLSDNHFTASLVGSLCLVIGDFKKGATLDDEKIKNFADNKTITANPKHAKTFKFTYSAAPIICTNHDPKAPDNSLGFRRRANVIPFTGQFYSKGKVDINRVNDILGNPNELSGILNLFLEGLRRLRERGRFNPPSECTEATDHWFHESNNTAKFADSCLKKLPSTLKSVGTGATYTNKIKFSDLYDNTFIPWLHEQGIDRAVPSKISLRRELEQLGFTIINGKANVVYLCDSEIIWHSAMEEF